MFNIRMGIPEMKAFWDNISKRIQEKSAQRMSSLFSKNW